MIDMIASEVQYAHHLVPVHRALGLGTFWVTTDLDLDVPTSRLQASHRFDRPVLTASWTDYSRARRRGATRLAYMEHGVGQSYGGTHPAYAGGTGRDDCSLILAPNDQAAARWRDRYPRTPIVVVGATRVLPAPPGGGRVVAVSFHWDGHTPETRSAFRVYRDVLVDLAQVVPVIGHAHPRRPWASRMAAWYRSVGIEYVPDLDQVARRASVYVADNTSSLYEMALARPVVALNAPWYRRDVSHGLRFWDLVPGPQVDQASDLVPLVARIVQDGETDTERAARLDVVRQVIPYTDGAQRASDALRAWQTADLEVVA